MSIHKSQGQTLERVKVDLGRVFEKGSSVLIANSHPHDLSPIQDKHMSLCPEQHH